MSRTFGDQITALNPYIKSTGDLRFQLEMTVCNVVDEHASSLGLEDIPAAQKLAAEVLAFRECTENQSERIFEGKYNHFSIIT
jgi:hypothetical protein